MSKAFGAATIARAAMLITGSTYVAYAAGLLASTLVARTLGPADYGRYAYVMWLSGVLVILMNNGLTTTSIRFVSESLGRGDPIGAAALARWLARWQAVAMGLVCVGFLLALPWLKPTGWTGQLSIFAVIVLLASCAKAAYLFKVSVAKGHGQFSLEAFSVTVLALVNTLGVVLIAWLGGGLWEMLLLFVAVCLCHPPLLWWQLRGQSRPVVVWPPGSSGTDPELLARMRNHLFWTILLTLVGAFSNKAIETFLLNRYAGAEVLAYFTIAVALTRGGVDLLSSGLNSILMPMMSHGYGHGGAQRAGEITADAARLYHFLGLLLAGVGLLWAQPMILWMYGDSFVPAVLALQVMVVVGGASLSNGALGALLSTTDHQRMRTAVVGSSIVVSVGVAVLLVPRFGLVGALASNAVSTMVIFIATTVIVQRTMHIRMPWARLARITAAFLIAGAVACSPLLALDTPWVRVLAGALFVPLYFVLSMRLGAWQTQDAKLLEGLTRRVPAAQQVVNYMTRWAV